MELYAVGDSFVFGPGVPAGKRWTALCAEESGWTVHSLGVNGDTLPGILVRINTVLPALLEKNGSLPGETCVLVSGGGNDIFCGCSARSLRPAAAAILQQLAARGLCPIACLPPMPLADSMPKAWRDFADPAGSAGGLKEYGEWLKLYCRTFKFPLLDLHPVFENADGSPRREYYLDGLHPNAAGHEAVAATLTSLLRGLTA